MKTKSLNILTVSLLLLGVMAIMLVVFIEQAHESFPDKIRVNSDGKTESVMAVQDLQLTPNEKKEYTVDLFCDASGSYHISLDYEETADGGMKDFVVVTVLFGDSVIYEGLLTELLDDGRVVQFEGELKAEDPLPVTISYEMPHDTGNEAKGTSADFDVHIIIEKS